MSAFEGCTNLVSASVHAATIEISDQAFMDCPRLASASFVADTNGDYDAATGAGSRNYLASSVFGNDAAFTNLTVGTGIATLGYPSPGVGFFLDGATDAQEEASRIHLSLPSGMEQDYLNAWVYGLIGYDDYDTYYGVVEFGMLSDWFMGEGPEPTADAVRAQMAQNLLEPENRLRTMMGLPLVKASTVIQADGDAFESDEWKIEDSGDGTATLVSAPSDIERADLASVLTGPTVIDSNAFSHCSNLIEIELCDKVVGIQSGAFAGCSGVTVTLPTGCLLPELLGGMESMPFSFGGNVALNIAEADREPLLKTWSRQMVGVATDDEEADYVESKWFGNVNMDTFESPTFDVLNKAVNEPIMECENRLRSLMGMEAISDIGELGDPLISISIRNIGSPARQVMKRGSPSRWGCCRFARAIHWLREGTRPHKSGEFCRGTVGRKRRGVRGGKAELAARLARAGRGELALDHLLGKAAPCQKDDRLGQLTAAFDNVVGERAPAQLGVRVRGMFAHGERRVEKQDALLCPGG